jgi:hypothetical protein
MIDSLYAILKKLFVSAYGESESLEPNSEPTQKPLQVRFHPPDDKVLADLQEGPLLSVYLADVRENRKLRKNDRVTMGAAPNQVAVQAPAQLDCHFLATAWSKVADNSAKKIQEESRLLYEAAAAVLRHNPIDALKVFRIKATFPDTRQLNANEWNAFFADEGVQEPVTGLASFIQLNGDNLRDRLIADASLFTRPLPIEALPPEGFSKLSEFWGLMGPEARWKPVVYFVVTIPVERKRQQSGTPVQFIHSVLANQSARATFRPDGSPKEANRESFIEVGGTVLRGGQPIKHIPVVLKATTTRIQLDENGSPVDKFSVKSEFTDTTDEQGRFTHKLLPDDLQDGFADWKWQLEVASQTFDLSTPLTSNFPMELNLT